MNSQAIQNKLNEYYNTATPEQVVKEFEDLGVEFVNTENMDLIKQLQKTPKWKEFEEWYNSFYIQNEHVPSLVTLVQVPPEMYKGVFEKFIDSQGQSYWYGNSGTHYLTYPMIASEEFNSFEELLIWYFNN